jgi:hypothetical protein
MAGALRPHLQMSASLVGIKPTALAPRTASRHSPSHSRLWRELALVPRQKRCIDMQ